MLVRHNVPMLSLQDVFSKEEIYDFVAQMKEQLNDPEFVVEYKIDGLSMTLRYENGELALAETRGDGINFGEDVTANAKVIGDVKKKLREAPEYLEIRGEVYMKNADFDAVNEKQELLGKKPFANPRNCAAGTLRQLDSAITKERKLSLFIFNIQQVRGMQFDTHTHASLPFAVRQVRIVSNTVFGILNDDMHFRPFLHQVTCQAKSDVVSIFVFVKFVLPYPSDSSGIGSAHRQ